MIEKNKWKEGYVWLVIVFLVIVLLVLVFIALKYISSNSQNINGDETVNIQGTTGGLISVNPAPSPKNYYEKLQDDLDKLKQYRQAIPAGEIEEKEAAEKRIREKEDQIKNYQGEMIKMVIDNVDAAAVDKGDRYRLAKKFIDENNFIEASRILSWGPDRPIYTIESPADHVTFNSITNNPAHGDERNFVQVREASASNETYADSISLAANHEYVVYAYYHNNAANNLNLVANGSYVRAEIPAVVANGASDVEAVVYVGANNDNLSQVWDSISFANATGGDIALRYVPGSATIHSFGAVDGQAMSDNIVTTGANLGYNALDGNIPGCNQYAGYITFRITADQPSFVIEEQVRIAGTDDWQKSVAAKVGDIIEYRIQYINAGTTQQNDVVIKSILPNHMSYINGSTVVKNTSNQDGKIVSDNITSDGINIGNYTPGSNAFLKFSAKIDSEGKIDYLRKTLGDFFSIKVDNRSILGCGLNALTSTTTVETSNGSKQDTALAMVTKDCN